MSSTISIIIPTYNRAHLINRAISSALAQCAADDEVIVVDDGSTDNTAEVVATFGDAVQYVRVPNGGAGSARNVGIKLATKDLVAFLDSDDEWFPHKLDLQRRMMDAQPNVLYCFSDFGVTLDDGSPIRNFVSQGLEDASSWQQTIGSGQQFTDIAELPCDVEVFPVHVRDFSGPLAQDLFILTSSFIARRIEAGDALHFGADLPIYEDWECFARLSLLGEGAYLDVETTWQHGTADTRVSQADNLARARAWLKMNERVWSVDSHYCQKHADTHKVLVAQMHSELVRSLIGAGQPTEARRLLGKCGRLPLYHRLLAYTPDSLLRRLIATRRWLTPLPTHA